MERDPIMEANKWLRANEESARRLCAEYAETGMTVRQVLLDATDWTDAQIDNMGSYLAGQES